MVFFLHGVIQTINKTDLNSGGKHIDVRLFDFLINHAKATSLITFDDGYQNVFRFAFPKLYEKKIPFKIFLTTDFIMGKKIWTDDLAIFSQSNRFIPIAREWAKEHDENNLVQYDSYTSLRLYLKTVPHEHRIFFMDSLRSALNENDLPASADLFDPLSIDEINEMLKSGLLTLGGHTVSHPILATLPGEKQFTEIFQNKEWLEDTFHKKIEDFAYPNGKKSDYDNETISILQKVGYKRAYTTIQSYRLNRFGPWEIPRIGISANLKYWQCYLIAKNIYPVRK